MLISEFEGFSLKQASLVVNLRAYVVWHSFASAQGQNITQVDTMHFGLASEFVDDATVELRALRKIAHSACHSEVKASSCDAYRSAVSMDIGIFRGALGSNPR